MVYYFLITGLGLTVIDKPSPSILRVPISAVRGKIPKMGRELYGISDSDLERED